MSLQLNQEQLEKLTHESAEIRLRALEQVELRFSRSLAHNELIAFKPVLMVKQLIRWFGLRPLQSPERVLRLLLLLLRSSYAAVIFRKMRRSRLIKELGKVHTIVRKNIQAIELVNEVQTLLEQQPASDNDEPATRDATPLTRTQSESSIRFSAHTSDDQENFHADEQENLYAECDSGTLLTNSDEYFEEPWSLPAVYDFSSMKSIADQLDNTTTSVSEADLENALVHLQFTMRDYPAEYLLQTPHLYQKLIRLHDANTNDSNPSPLVAQVQRTLLLYLESLSQRITLRRRVLNYAAPEPTESAAVSAKIQLKPEAALMLLLDSCLKYLTPEILEFHATQFQLIELLRMALKIYQQLAVAVPDSIIEQIAALCARLQRNCLEGKAVNTPRLKYMLLTGLLQAMLIHGHDLKQNVSNLPQLEYLRPLTRDYALKLCLPDRTETLLLLLSQTNHNNFNEQMQQLQIYEKSINLALQQLKPQSALPSDKLLLTEPNISLVLEKLGSIKLIKLLFDAIVDCNARYATEPLLLRHAELLLHTMLRLGNERLRLSVHKQLRQHILRHFHCFMNHENYVAGKSNNQLIAATVVGVPLNLVLLRTLISNSHQDTCKEIQQICVDCLCLLLKMESLLGERFQHVMTLLEPLMPLLISRCCKDAEMQRLLLQLHDPDTSCRPFLQLLKGNICFLFHPTPAVRHEAVSRLAYMLNCSDQKHKWLPDVMQVRDVITDDICLVLPARNYSQIFNTLTAGVFRDQHTMLNLCELLDTPDIEPVIRKSTLMQLNVMLQSWKAALAYAEYEAYVFPLTALKNALKRDSAVEYNDAAIPAVSMLSKLFLVNKNFRKQITATEDLYMLLLRALFHFRNNIQLRQDASLCLFQLVFDEYMSANETGLTLPELVSNLHVPVSYVTAYNADLYTANTLESQLLLDYFGGCQETELRYWRLHIATYICQRHEGIELEAISALDISDKLKLQKQELNLLHATQLPLQLRRYLNACSNATDHVSLIKLIDVVKLYLLQMRGEVPHELGVSLYTLIGKYLHLQPGNELDYQLFAQMLELSEVTVRLGLQPVIEGLSSGLQTDANHALIVLLRQHDTQLHLYARMVSCLEYLLAARGSFEKPIGENLWFGSCFQSLYQLARELFAIRDLQRVRGLLAVLCKLSARHLALADHVLLAYCRQSIRFSYELKVFSQTGAQWHRDCLRIIIQLHAQMEQPAQHFHFRANTLKLLMGLCGHKDAQVRALAWIVIADIASSSAAADKKGSELLMEELQHLPGGFLACCLSTLQDHTDTTLVRQFAGRVFIKLSKDTSVQSVLELLERHAFLPTALQALSQTQLNEELSIEEDPQQVGELDACEIIGSYVRICIQMLKMQPQWSQHLCGHAFMLKLYELFKLPPATLNASYRRLCADICDLYTHCYPLSMEFLQRTMCRDPVLLLNFVILLDDMVTQPDELLIQFVKLLAVFCKDDSAYWYVTTEFSKKPAVPVNLCLRAFKLQNVNTSIQRDTLTALTLLLNKAQQLEYSDNMSVPTKQELQLTERSSLVSVLEQHRTTATSRAISPTTDKENELNVLNNKFCRMSLSAHETTTDTASQKTVKSTSTAFTKHVSPTRSDHTNGTEEHQNAAALIFIDLDRLFTHLYPLKRCKFTQPPSQLQMQVCETLGMLLKLSPSAQEAACNLRLLERIMEIVCNFLDDFNMPVTTFIRRHGEQKSQAIISNLMLLFQLIFHWHSSHHAVITDELQALRIVKLLICIWPWVAQSAQLKLLIMNTCAFLSEHSFVVCKQMSTLIPHCSDSLLQLVVKHVNFETMAVRAASTDSFPVIERGLRVITNCCACTEGRLSLVKLHILDSFDALLPGHNTHQLRLKPEILQAWLRFWEVFSRYEAGGKACHVHTLLKTVQRAPPRSTTRLLCLRILRNMCFVPTNRSQLVALAELLNTMDDIVKQPMHEYVNAITSNNTKSPRRSGGAAVEESSDFEQCYEEQHLVTICLWKLFGAGARYKAMLRGTKLAKHLRILREQLASIAAEQPQRMRRLRFAAELAEELDLMFQAINN